MRLLAFLAVSFNQKKKSSTFGQLVEQNKKFKVVTLCSSKIMMDIFYKLLTLIDTMINILFKKISSTLINV